MGLEDFINETDEQALKEADFQFIPYDATMSAGVQTIESAMAVVDGTEVVVELDEPHEVSIHEADEYDELNAAVASQLARDRVWDLFNQRTTLASNEEFTPVLDDNSKLLEVLEAIVELRVATRSDVNEVLDSDAYYQNFDRLKDLHMISHISNDGNAHVFTATPRGMKEVLARSSYGELTLADSDEEEQTEDVEEITIEQPEEEQTL